MCAASRVHDPHSDRLERTPEAVRHATSTRDNASTSREHHSSRLSDPGIPTELQATDGANRVTSLSFASEPTLLRLQGLAGNKAIVDRLKQDGGRETPRRDPMVSRMHQDSDDDREPAEPTTIEKTAVLDETNPHEGYYGGTFVHGLIASQGNEPEDLAGIEIKETI